MTSPNDVIAQLRAALGFIERDVRVGELTDGELAHIARFMEIADAAALTQAVETEREECAKVADATAERFPNDTMHYRYGFSDAADVIASAIRARSTQDKT